MKLLFWHYLLRPAVVAMNTPVIGGRFSIGIVGFIIGERERSARTRVHRMCQCGSGNGLLQLLEWSCNSLCATLDFFLSEAAILNSLDDLVEEVSVDFAILETW